MNSSQSQRRLIRVESRCADHLGRAATRTQQGGGELHQALDWLLETENVIRAALKT